MLDTNIVLDWLVFANPAVLPLAAAIAGGSWRWIATDRMLDELAHVLERGGFRRWAPDAGSVLAAARVHVDVVEAPPPCGLVCTDSDDQVFLDLALQRRVGWLVTRDRALLRLTRQAQVRGTGICTPAAMCTALAELLNGKPAKHTKEPA